MARAREAVLPDTPRICNAAALMITSDRAIPIRGPRLKVTTVAHMRIAAVRPNVHRARLRESNKARATANGTPRPSVAASTTGLPIVDAGLLKGQVNTSHPALC